VSPGITLSEPSDLTGFPVTPPPTRLHRVCREVNGTWWFSCDGSGRFDLEPPEGTCYFATDLYAAIREASRLGPVTPRWIVEREARGVAPPDPRARLAATTRKSAGAYGLTQELATLVPYDLPRRWAKAFRAHGMDGIRHQLRHDPRARPGGVSLFGGAGAGPAPEGERRRLDVQAVQAAGVRVIEPPHSTVLTILP
jgi:hypothetical protein